MAKIIGITKWMSGEIGAIGDVVTGAVIAAGIDDDHVARGPGGVNVRCLNCGTFLADERFCPQCGQPRHIHRSVGAFWHDLLHSVLHFEGKLWRTLPMLFFRPGELTRRYINGERARYFSPLALFLFAVFFTFGMFSLIDFGTSDNPMSAAQRQTTVNQITGEFNRAQRETEQRIADARARGQDTRQLEQELAQNIRVRDAAERMVGITRTENGEVTRQFSFMENIETGNPTVDAAIEHANENPALMLYKLQSNAYKWAWALIPLSAPFLWLLYPFSRRFGLYDHLVFVTYSITFMLFLTIFSVVTAYLGSRLDSGGLGAIALSSALFYPPLHIFWQLRGTYGSSRFGALVRMLILVCVAITLLFLFGTGLLALGAMG
ncbi:MAG: DUF3667 domain-containing protein [Sphingopyxis sp.]|nr:DUF3667 domain-containing protein [Sphingopyxis sp.]